MKYYIITFHRAQSYGAFLQAFALQNLPMFKSNKPTIIDYFPNRFSYDSYVKELSGSLFSKLVKFVPNLIAKKRMYKCIIKYVNSYLVLTNKTYRSSEELIDDEFDKSIIISGSDQIWDIRYDEISAILPYYLSFHSGKRISYASSCGEMDFIKNKDNPVYKMVLKELLQYRHISVREIEHEKQLNSISQELNVVTVLDPTLLLSKKEWFSFIEKFEKRKVGKKPYILVYGLYRNKELFKYAMKLAKKEKCGVINICDMLDFKVGAKNIYRVNPFLLIKLIYYSKHVVTDSFHGCAFSLNFGKELHIFMPKTSTKRIESLCSMFDINDRVIRNPNELLIKRMDMEHIEKLMINKREFSYKYLKKAIDD